MTLPVTWWGRGPPKGPPGGGGIPPPPPGPMPIPPCPRRWRHAPSSTSKGASGRRRHLLIHCRCKTERRVETGVSCTERQCRTHAAAAWPLHNSAHASLPGPPLPRCKLPSKQGAAHAAAAAWTPEHASFPRSPVPAPAVNSAHQVAAHAAAAAFAWPRPPHGLAHAWAAAQTVAAQP